MAKPHPRPPPSNKEIDELIDMIRPHIGSSSSAGQLFVLSHNMLLALKTRAIAAEKRAKELEAALEAKPSRILPTAAPWEGGKP